MQWIQRRVLRLYCEAYGALGKQTESILSNKLVYFCQEGYNNFFGQESYKTFSTESY